MAEATSLEQFEKKSRRFGDLLGEINLALAQKEYEREKANLPEGEFMPDFSPDRADIWGPFTEEELDRIRHYYWQKMSLEEQGVFKGLGIPMWHELSGSEGFVKQALQFNAGGVKESLYDLYVNAIAVKDYFSNYGQGGSDVYNILESNPPRETFENLGQDVLERIEYVPEQSLSMYEKGY
jgi:hypothetical protein